MKKLYATLLLAALSLPAFTISADETANPGQVDETIVNGGWKNIGRGMWYEDLLCYYEDFMDAAGQNWRVDVEESETTPGYYRILPYYEGTIIAQLNEDPDWNYFYIDARDPEKVIAKDFAPYDYFAMAHTVVENGWKEDASKGYGKLVDRIITFPPKAFSMYIDMFGEWAVTSEKGMKIALPGADIVDYTIGYSLDFCQPSSSVEFNLEYGTSASKALTACYEGYFAATDENIAIVAQNADQVENGKQTLANQSDGFHTLFVILLDAEGKVAASKVSYFFVYNDVKSEWEELGEIDYSDDIYGSLYANRLPFTRSHKVTVEQNKTTPGLYRLVNPYNKGWEYYTRLSLYLDMHDHDHYIVIDATDPDKVVLKSSNLGVNAAFMGYGIIESVPSFNESQGMPAGNLYGTLKNNEISFPENGIVLYEHADPAMAVRQVNSNGRFKFTLPASSGINSVGLDSADEAEAPVYYDVTGRVVAHPVAGQLYIKRCGANAEKVIF